MSCWNIIECKGINSNGRMGLHFSSQGWVKDCCLFSKEGIECNLIGQFATDSFSLLSVKMCNNIQLFFICLSQATNNIKEELWEKIDILRDESLHLIMIGDFNIDSRDFDVLTQHFIENNLVQLVKEPTHIEGRIIDHVWVSKMFPKFDLSHQYPYYTQHKSIIIRFE